MTVDPLPSTPPTVRRGPETPRGGRSTRSWVTAAARAGKPRAARRRRAPGRGYRLASHVVLGAACAVIVMAAALAVGMRLDDRQIDRHRGTATATVLSISALRTGIEFVDGAGVSIRPPDGVLYPGLLSVGQRFQIEYSTVDPTVVRVAGRTAAVGTVLLAITVGVTILIALAVVCWLRRKGRRVAARSAAAPTVEYL